MKKEKKVKKGKNVMKVLLSVIIIFVTALIIYEVSIWYDGNLDSSNPMSREEVVRLLEKGKEYPNYYYSPQYVGIFSDKNKTEYYIKDNIEVVYFNSKVSTWFDYNVGEGVHILNGNIAAVATNISINRSNEVNQRGFDYSLIANKEPFNYEYKYLGEKLKNGRTLIVVSVWNEEDKGIPIQFVIDKETGLIFERSDYLKLGPLTIKSTCDRNVKLDIVTDEDIKRPDLSGYEILGK